MYLLRDFIEPGVTLASPVLQPIVREVVAAASKRALDQLTGQAGAAAVALCVETAGKLLLDASLARDAASAIDIAIRLASMSTRFGLTNAGSLAVILEEGAQNELRVPEADFWFRARRALDGTQQHRRAEAQRLVKRASLSNLALRAAVAFVMPELPLWSEEQTAEVHGNLSFLNPAVGDLYLLGLLRDESWATTGPKWPPTSKAMQQVPAPLLPLALALIGDQKALSKLTKALEAQAAAEDLDTLINVPLDEDHVLMTWARATPRAAATRKAIARMLSSSPVDRAFLKTLITSWLVSAPQMAVEDPVAKQLRAEAFFDLPPAPLRDDLEQPGQRRPRWPSWLDETRLPGLALRDGRAKLDGEAVRAVVALAQRATLDDASALLKATSDVKPEALSAFASTVFVSWLGASGPPKEKWAMELLAHFPSDAWVAVLGARCEEWARGSFSARAKLGVEVLARMTSRAACQKKGCTTR